MTGTDDDVVGGAHPHEPTRVRVHVVGIVQGVGFRPYVHRLATAAGLTGHVGNDARGVVIEVQGPAPAVDAFVDALPQQAPALAHVDDVRVETIAPSPDDVTFTIVGSQGAAHRDVLVSPDVATCDDCLAELWDPTDRRHRYPFVNCTNCGPRFTIVRDVPYDRSLTTMAEFVMCAACRAEYEDPTDRRFHAQPVCCPDCGPTLRLVDGDAVALDDDPIRGTARLLAAGRVVAVKGLGGYHLAVDATDDAATARLRARKHREDRPFAILVADLAVAEALCHLDDAERELLTSPARPILLARRRDDRAVAPSVAPGTVELGLVLPYTPLHHLLCAAVDRRPLVLTSGNVSDEPIAHDDEDAFTRLASVADAFLTHDRPIHTRTDDSVVRVVAGAPTPVRRSRGFVPAPLTVPWRFPHHVLACGAELKNTFCLARDRRTFVSHHVGDLENWETLRAFTDGIAHMARLFDVQPSVVAHDLHPEYLSTKHAVDLADADERIQLVGVQHHHAHVASCLADNGVAGPVIGVAYDGLGLGTDGTLWGGEVLVADLREARRVAHLEHVAMPGGAAAVREPWRMAAAHLLAAGLLDRTTTVADRHRDQWEAVVGMARTGANAPATSSIGRLFDAIAALVGLRDRVTFEGQAAIALEQVAAPDVHEAYPARVTDDDPAILRADDLVRAVVDDLADGVPVPTIAARFHGGVAAMTVEACERTRDREGLTTVALSGGVFQNVRLVTALTAALQDRGFTVLTHHRVPPNDGGISLGQAVVAAARCP